MHYYTVYRLPYFRLTPILRRSSGYLCPVFSSFQSIRTINQWINAVAQNNQVL